MQNAAACTVAFLLALLRAGAADADHIDIIFDTYPNGLPVPGGASIGSQWVTLGVVFSDKSGGPASAANNHCSLTPPNHAYGATSGTVVATFVNPDTGSPTTTRYAGTAQDNCWFSGEGIAMRAYDADGHLLASIFNAGNGHFSAFNFPEAIISRIEMDGIGQGIDNFVFDSVVGSPPLNIRTIDFDKYPNGSSVPIGPTIHNQWATLGVAFSAGNGNSAYAVATACSLSAPNHVSGGSNPTIIATFVDPVSGVPAATTFAGTAQDLCSAPGEGILMRAYDYQGHLLGSKTSSGGGNFEGFAFDSPVIARLEMEPIGQGIDDFRFAIPTALLPSSPIQIPTITLLSTLALGSLLGFFGWLDAPRASRSR